MLDSSGIIVGAGPDFFGIGGHTLFIRGGDGWLHAWSFDAAGALTAGTDFTAQGAHAAIDSGTTVIGGGQDFFGNAGRTLFLRGGDGSLHAWAADGSGQLTAGMDFLSQGTALTIGSATTVVGAGSDFFGNGDRSVFVRGPDGSLGVMAFHADATLDLFQSFTVAGGAPALLAPGATVVGSAGDYFDTGGHALILQDASGARHTWEFDSQGHRTGVQ